MDTYLIAKFMHIACAVIWLGGGFALVVLGLIADRARSTADFLAVMRMVTQLAPRLFIPGSLLVLLFGLIMVWLGQLAFDAWIVIGLAGIAATAAIGTFILGPMAGRVVALSGNPATHGEAVRVGRRMLTFAKVDYVLQFAIVFVMVLKPVWSDLAILAGLGTVVALAVAILMIPARPRLAPV
jgi:uncharacterized membrane protein